MTSSTSSGTLRSEIEGGAIRGGNLFHSFLDLNIAPGESLYFQNPIGISNIISRVTGLSPSNIEGILGVTGNANLFLLNPNGILFGANARLDVSGSFIATTAPAIQFGTQGFFSTSTPESPALLTVSPSAFLFNQVGIAAIVNRSRTPLAAGGQGLQVPDGQSLLLLGGAVTLDGGGVNATGGRIELGAVSGPGTVGLSLVSNNWYLSFPDAIDRSDITLTNGATVSTSGEGGGPIQIWGKSVFVNGGAQIAAFSQGDKSRGDLIVNASESLEVLGVVENGNLSTLSFGDGKAGNLIIETQRLIVRDGAQIFTGTLGSNVGGRLSVNASESVEIGGRDPLQEFSSNLSSFTGSTGKAGNLTINTKKLIIRDGGALSAEALPDIRDGKRLLLSGAGGNLTVNASDAVDLLREGFILTSTQSPGNAGDIVINTGRLLVQDRSLIGAVGLSTGNAGNIAIQARSITLTNQSDISATTKSSQGGSIALQVQDFLLLRQGSSISTTAGTAQAGGNGGNITFKGNFILAIPKENSDITANAFTGRGGNINIMAQNLLGIQYRPQPTPLSDITVSSTFGSAGSATIDTPDIDPSRGLLPTIPNPTDATRLFLPDCSAIRKSASRFVITGRGGFPPIPSEAIHQDAIQVELVTTSPNDGLSPLGSKQRPTGGHRPTQKTTAQIPTPAPLLEAQAIEITPNGIVKLVSSQSVGDPRPQCTAVTSQ